VETTLKEKIVIEENKVCQMGVLELAVSDIKEQDYVDEKGENKKELSSCIRVSNVTSGKEKEFHVGQGSIIDLDEYGRWMAVRVKEGKKHHGFIELKKE
jgi:hypothetical protein|tara:strand:- start:1358 stop:1654 length:297 start_codon:yes stop_codon:yes gene_type:complete